MTPRLKVVTQEGCRPCEELREILHDGIVAGDVQLVPIESAEGQELATRFGLTGTPSVLLDTNGKLSRCRLSREDDGTVVMDCEPPEG